MVWFGLVDSWSAIYFYFLLLNMRIISDYSFLSPRLSIRSFGNAFEILLCSGEVSVNYKLLIMACSLLIVIH